MPIHWHKAEGPFITDVGLSYLEGWTDLKSLRIWYSKISDDGLKYLSGLTKLEFLDLSETRIGDAQVVSIFTRDLVDAVMDTFVGEPDVLLCDNASCDFCVRARRLLRHHRLPPWDHLESVVFP